MEISTELLVIVGVLGVVSQWLAWRLRLPAILLLTLSGILAGPVLGLLRPSDQFGPLLQPMVGLFVAVILFEGGLNLRIHEFREARKSIPRLVFPGVPVAWLLGSLAARYVGGLTWEIATLFGAIIVVTGPTVIMPLLRHSRLKRRPAALLKWEGIINDPIGALLSILVYEFLIYSAEGAGTETLFARVFFAVLFAVAVGTGGGFLSGAVFRRGLVPEYLKPPVLLGTVLLVYALANAVFHEAGLVAATVMGMVVGNRALPSIGELRRFKEHLAILLVSVLFILLTADLDLATLSVLLEKQNLLLLAALIFLVRPVTVFLSTAGSEMEPNERLLIGWIAPRGVVAAAVAGLFGPRLAALGYDGAELLLPLVFGLILVTITLHGLSIGALAKKLGLAFRDRNGVLLVGGSSWATELSKTLVSLDVPVLLADTSWHRLRDARLSGVPVYFGEVLSEDTEQSVEFNQIGCLLAATSNDAYNAMVCSHFARELGRGCVYQLPIFGEDEHSSRMLPAGLRGVEVLARELPYEELESRTYQGWAFRKTRLSESYDYSEYIHERPESALDVLVVRKAGGVDFVTTENVLVPEAGDTLVSFLPSEDGKEHLRA